jgi:hypothetical protein
VKEKRKIKGTLIYTLILLILYLLLFPFPSGREITVRPKNIHYLPAQTSNTNKVRKKEGINWFRNGVYFGYVDNDGNVIYKATLNYNITLSHKGFINYSSIQDENQSLVFLSPYGEFISSFMKPGYPLFSSNGERLFLIKTNATGFREITLEGEYLWEAHFASIITGFSANRDFIAVGLLNGILKLFNRGGECIYTLGPGRSRLSVIYGCAVSHRGRTIAAVYGIDPQHIIIVEKDGLKFSTPYYRDMNTDFRRPVILRFSYDDKFLFYEGRGRLHILDVNAHRFFDLSLPGKLIDVCPLNNRQLVVWAARDVSVESHDAEITLCIPPSYEVIKEKCEGKNISIGQAGDLLTLCIDDGLMVLKVLEV